MTPRTMRAVALDGFGGPEVLRVQEVPVPEVGPGEVLIAVEVAGVGEWDPFEREGGYARMTGVEPRFPYVLGSEGAGTVAALGEGVAHLAVGDRVYAVGFLNPKGGFYAEYAVADAGLVARVPERLTTEEAGVMAGVGLTALRGLDDVLMLEQGESLMIFGASGGVGHVAVQLARRMGARVLAVASGYDGVELAERLGADAVVNGRDADVLGAARDLAPDGLDAALLTAGGEAAERALDAVKEHGRVAWPNGIRPEPAPRPGMRMGGYNGEPEPEILARFHELVATGRFEVHVSRTFPLEAVADAHRALGEHHLGKLALRVRGGG